MADIEEQLFPRRKERVEDRRKERTQRKLADEFFDHSTLLSISRLVTQGQFETLDYPISTGKEGGVFRATGPNGFRAVKVYRIGNTIFRRLPPHVLVDLKRVTSLGNFGRLVAAWTRREHTILSRLHDAEVRCPTPFAYYRNVLVMEFVGTEGLPAPPLHEAQVDDAELLRTELETEIRKMTVKAKYVHGDLSPYNVLYHEGHPVLIDVAQAMPTDHPQALSLLERDAGHFARYFSKLGVPTTPASFFHEAGGDELPKKA